MGAARPLVAGTGPQSCAAQSHQIVCRGAEVVQHVDDPPRPPTATSGFAAKAGGQVPCETLSGLRCGTVQHNATDHRERGFFIDGGLITATEGPPRPTGGEGGKLQCSAGARHRRREGGGWGGGGPGGEGSKRVGGVFVCVFEFPKTFGAF